MKYMYSILTVVLLSSVFLSSCSQNETLIDEEHAPLQFELNVKGGSPVTRTRATVGDTVFVFVYSVAGDSAPIIQLKDELKGDNTILYCTPEDGFVRASSYNIFIVATSSDALQKTLKSPMSQTALCDLIQDKEGLGVGGNEYLISGGLRGVTFNNPSKAINLLRNVCHLELSITDQTASKYKSVAASFDSPDQTYMFASDVRGSDGIPAGATDMLNSVTLEKKENVYSGNCYFFEKSDGITLNIQAIGVGEAGRDTTFNYKVVLASTERNTIYRVNAGLNLTELTMTASTDMNWKGNIEEDQELTPVNP